MKSANKSTEFLQIEIYLLLHTKGSRGIGTGTVVHSSGSMKPVPVIPICRRITIQFTTLDPASETGNNIFHPCATDSPENSYLCSGK